MANRFRNGFESGREARNSSIEAAYAAHPIPSNDFELIKFSQFQDVGSCLNFFQELSKLRNETQVSHGMRIHKMEILYLEQFCRDCCSKKERGRPPKLRPITLDSHRSYYVSVVCILLSKVDELYIINVGDELLSDSLYYKEIKNGILGEHANSSAKGGGEDEDWARNATQIVSKGVDQV
ncbi:hypothetical protein Tco_1271383 [Tanacetum coccineum]